MHGHFIGAGFAVDRAHPHHVRPGFGQDRQQTRVGTRPAVVVAGQLLPGGRKKLDNRIESVRADRHADHVARVTRELPQPGITPFILVHVHFIGAGFAIERGHSHHVRPGFGQDRQQTRVGTRPAVVVAGQLLPGGRKKLDNRIESVRADRHADHVARVTREFPHPGSHGATSKVAPGRIAYRDLHRRHLVHGHFIGSGFAVERGHSHHVPPGFGQDRQQTRVGARPAVVIAGQLVPRYRQKINNRI